MIDIYTDGSFRPPRFGAYGWVIVKDDAIIHECAVRVEDTTNNRMELFAILESLRVAVKLKQKLIHVYTDSQYAFLSVTTWCKVWKKNQWLGRDQQTIKNLDILQPLFELSEKLNVNYHWVRAHNGNPYNEAVDRLVQAETHSMSTMLKVRKK
jgi:ribonuclease HI